jgi:hypothetical protein
MPLHVTNAVEDAEIETSELNSAEDKMLHKIGRMRENGGSGGVVNQSF